MGQVGQVQPHSHKNKKSENENNTSCNPFTLFTGSPYSRNPLRYEHSRKKPWESNEKATPFWETFITQNEISSSPQLIPAHNPSPFAPFLISSPTSPLFCWKIKRHCIEDQTTFHRHSSETNSPQPAISYPIVPVPSRSIENQPHFSHETLPSIT